MTQHTETPGTTHGPEGHGGPPSPVDSGPASYRDLQLANRRLGSRNEQLLAALQASRAKLSDMNERLAALSEPPSTYGVLIEPGPAGTGTAEIFTANRRMRVQVAPTVDTDSLVPGATVRLADGLQVVEVTGYADSGDVATVVEVVDSRIVVADKMGEETLVTCAGPLRREAAAGRVGAGDSVIVDRRAGYAFEVIARAEVEDSFTAALVRMGMISPDSAGFFSVDDVDVVRIAHSLDEHGIDRRHLKSLVTMAQRHVDIVHRVSAPVAHGRDDNARQRSLELAREVSALVVSLHAAMVKGRL